MTMYKNTMHQDTPCLCQPLQALCSMQVRPPSPGAPVELGRWLINQREAQRSSDMVSCRHEAGPFVLSTRLGLQEMADHP